MKTITVNKWAVLSAVRCVGHLRRYETAGSAADERVTPYMVCGSDSVMHEHEIEELETTDLGLGYTLHKSLQDGKPYGIDEPYEVDYVTRRTPGTDTDMYVGDPDLAKYLIEKGIEAEHAAPGGTVCCIGFCPTQQKWYGWSHRAMCGFGVGDRLFVEEYGNDNTLFTQHGPETISTLDMARQAAINFARHVG